MMPQQSQEPAADLRKDRMIQWCLRRGYMDLSGGRVRITDDGEAALTPSPDNDRQELPDW